ncbi:general odorant-binding protein 83a-like [Cimex lectularius]|uniref:Odorant binding protein n=1 Tax=Cimex lectularius TaxID=79782 RepID=A0A8I6S747_CIMLE|nr:general odorant-binding protein 83a-like [Cimex lectularius]
MLVLLVLSSLIACSYGLTELPPDMQEMAKALHDNCVDETGVDPGLIKPCETGNFADDPKLKCYFKCIFAQVGAISDDDVLDADAFASILPDTAVGLMKSVGACKESKGADGCDLAMNFYKCVYDKDPASFIVI